jgi:hypothetical protein
MANKKNIYWILSTLILLFFVIIIIMFNNKADFNNTIKCKDFCIENNWEDGQCDWPRLFNESYLIEHNITFPFPYDKFENKGSCVEAMPWMKSNHCGNEGQCNCYCFNYK